jgi:1-acyl-sn-glycerol-3-phosphate acyltransferase
MMTIFNTPFVSPLLRGISRSILRLVGWRIEGEPPCIPKFVVIGAPHTSNWDFPLSMLIAFSYKIPLQWLGKDSLFRFPFGLMFRWMGGIPVDRSKRQGKVEQTVAMFNERERLYVMIAPEGTRKKVAEWKTGFYYIALGAGIPIVPGFLDYKRKAGGLAAPVMPTGNIDADMKVIRGFYAGVTGRHPERTESIVAECPRED